MRPALTALCIAVLVAAMALAPGGAVFGGSLAAGELRRAPAALAAVALLVLRRGPGALPAAAGWALLGAAAAVLLRDATGFPAPGGAIPGEASSRAEALADAGWLAAIAVLAWRGVAPGMAGPLAAAVVATTRIGGYGQELLPILWEDTALDAVVMGAGVSAGLAAGMIVLLLGGWAVSILARMPERWMAPGRVLSVLAVAAALGHMLRG